MKSTSMQNKILSPYEIILDIYDIYASSCSVNVG